jgi:hypothetical protein
MDDSQANEIFDLLERFSDLLTRAQARTERALVTLGIGQDVYQNPMGQQSAGPGSGPTLGRPRLTA